MNTDETIKAFYKLQTCTNAQIAAIAEKLIKLAEDYVRLEKRLAEVERVCEANFKKETLGIW